MTDLRALAAAAVIADPKTEGGYSLVTPEGLADALAASGYRLIEQSELSRLRAIETAARTRFLVGETAGGALARRKLTDGERLAAIDRALEAATVDPRSTEETA